MSMIQIASTSVVIRTRHLRSRRRALGDVNTEAADASRAATLVLVKYENDNDKLYSHA